MRNKEALLVRLRTQLDAIPTLLANRDSDAIQQRPATGKWSALENLAHLARYHEVFIARIDRILAENAPLLPRYRAEDHPHWEGWRARSQQEILDQLKILRSDLVRRVETLNEEQLNRVGVHALFGTLALRSWLEVFLFHEGHHLYVALTRLPR
jgi:hypothetical protein